MILTLINIVAWEAFLTFVLIYFYKQEQKNPFYKWTE